MCFWSFVFLLSLVCYGTRPYECGATLLYSKRTWQVARSVPIPSWVLRKCLVTIHFLNLWVLYNSRMFTARPSTDLNVHLCQVLWEVLALNIVHCELVTREEAPLKVDVASSSSSSSTVQPKDQQTWGGRSAHWIALRELGKLAMFTYRVPYAGNRGNKTD